LNARSFAQSVATPSPQISVTRIDHAVGRHNLFEAYRNFTAFSDRLHMVCLYLHGYGLSHKIGASDSVTIRGLYPGTKFVPTLDRCRDCIKPLLS
jgi:hypothetical protein